MNEYKDIWNKNHIEFFTGTIKYDNWLETYLDIIKSCKKAVIDLGCGTGNNTLYLIERGKSVIACDFAEEAIKIVNENIPSVKTKQFDMKDNFPFDDNVTDLVIADLCLHYFSFEETKNILNKIKRILVNNGYLIFRVNSINDVNNGAMQGIEIEKHYYEVEGMKKRFFDKDDLLNFFKDFEIIELKEEIMTRYTKPKMLWKGIVKNKK